MTLAGPPAHLSQWELSLELLLPDSCWASSRIFSMSPLWMDSEAGTCSWLPADTELPLPLPLPLLLKCSSTQDPAGQREELSPSASGLCYRAPSDTAGTRGHRASPAPQLINSTECKEQAAELGRLTGLGSSCSVHCVSLCTYRSFIFG